MTELPFPDRRRGKDRRAAPTSPWRSSSLWGRRRYTRRKEDRFIHYYVDRYGRRSVLTIFAALLLSIADAFLTLKLVGLGATEINPVMDFCLRLGPATFLGVKYALTALGLTFLLIHKNYHLLKGRLQVKSLLAAIPLLYLALVVYELLLVGWL